MSCAYSYRQVVDEGQRLKNRQSKLFTALKDFRTEQRLLLSGTPLQNNMQELFNMLEFLQLPQFKGKERTQIVAVRHHFALIFVVCGM